MPRSKYFALDIGTRSIVGLIMEQTDSGYYITDMVQKEHKERAMLDGQIHHVPAVAALILDIKSELEKRHGALTHVSVAAAGRALNTQRSTYAVPLSGRPALTKEDILHMELSAVQAAQEAAAESQENSHHYHCVGYSVLHYFLDQQEIGSLEDQQGDEASVEIIATFLPRVVVESLLASLKRAGLIMSALTLEPIAAINVLIPPSMRRLNVALVDIGAGTSDIAITNHGTVTAYGMVPVAGDEMTEKLSDTYLLDFPNAEGLKRALSDEQESIEITDILGFSQELSKHDVITDLLPAVDKLAHAISGEIRRLNNEQAPKAVMLVGGGSQTPGLTQLLAEKLDLPENRVAVRGIEAIQNLTLHDSIKRGPELVTPAGIAISANQTPINYIPVTVNGHEIRMFEVKELTVGDAILSAGLSIPKLYGKPGLAKMITLNGHTITLPGTHGEAPSIILNGAMADLDTAIKAGDDLTIQKGKDGQASEVSLKAMLEESLTFNVYVNGETVHFIRKVFVNGKEESADYVLMDRDDITVQKKLTIADACQKAGFSLQQNKTPFSLVIDSKTMYFPQWDGELLVNKQQVNRNAYLKELNPHDQIDLKKPVQPTVSMLKKAMEVVDVPFFVTFNGEKVEFQSSGTEFYRNDLLLSPDEPLETGDELKMKRTAGHVFFQDIFSHIDWTPPVKSGKIDIRRNGEKSELTAPISSGDVLEIIFD
ncbi:cell division protein FtsA [Jeotgalibacillus aurantiacus]|uniref:cell division protein FtsA n=1 Tax=Jeotgalibacillus aurantiacus TaxID=2763266 RepID=UPI001D09C1E7|nr:cell division FtsA domain-containing protein [Jeotgalibacillus aurantiacus]